MARWMTKALAVTPGVLISTVLTCMIGVVLPAPAALVLFIGGLLTGVVLSTGATETAAARLLVFSRPATPVELGCLAGALTLLCRVGLGPPVVRLRVRAGEKAIAAGGFGRHTVVISSGLLEAVEDGSLPPEQAAAVIAHAAGLVRGGLVRQDPVLAFWTLPWQVLRAVCQVAASAGRRVPLTSPAWRLRGVVIGVAVVQGLQQRQPWLAAAIGVHRRRQLRDAGVGATLADVADRPRGPGGECGRVGSCAGVVPAPLSTDGVRPASTAAPGSGARPVPQLGLVR